MGLNILKKRKFIFNLLRIKCCNVLLNVCYCKTSSRYSVAQLNCSPSLFFFFPEMGDKIISEYFSTEKSKFYKMANITKVRIMCISIISMFLEIISKFQLQISISFPTTSISQHTNTKSLNT